VKITRDFKKLQDIVGPIIAVQDIGE